jgi:hypothetical protein
MGQKTRDYSIPRVVGFYMLTGLAAHKTGIVFKQFAYSGSHRSWIMGLTETPGIEGNNFAQGACLDGDNGNTASHGFKRDQAKGFLVSCMEQDITAGNQARHFRCRTETIHDGDVVGYMAGHVRAYQEQVIGLTQLTGRFK